MAKSIRSPKALRPSDGELEILQVLWQHGPLSVRAVNELLTKAAGYTTTLKLLQIMLEKGLVWRDDRSKIHIYEAAVTQADTQGQLVQRMIETVFKGSAMNLVLQALGNHRASDDEMAQIKAYLEQAEASRQKG